ncbi:hypothetical protein CMI47_01335 [Candidatus Pacearchaeota archaeon]|jgi:hypothetical protein|nr:hypothetical protein [Candidatus Pacearchaeota archaeon]|tara:strand:+ start:10172 stop:10927 length:756 start_codon:yes stop_codon:yes gene_type:complete
MKDMKDIHMKHKGKLGFLVCSGPSLRDIDKDLLKDYVALTINSSIVGVPDCDYFLSDDVGVKNWSYYIDDAKKSKCTKLLYSKKLKKHASHFCNDDVIFFDHTWYYDPRSKKYNLDGLVMTQDCNKPIIGARTSSASGLHMLYIMGCDPIVILGMDCHYSMGKRYFWQFWDKNKPFRTTGEPVFSRANAGRYKGQSIDSHCRDMLEYWRLFNKKNRDLNSHIINCSMTSTIEQFKKQTLEQVLLDYGSRKK